MLKKQKTDMSLFDILLTLKEALKLKKACYYENNRQHIYTGKWSELEDKL